MTPCREHGSALWGVLLKADVPDLWATWQQDSFQELIRPEFNSVLRRHGNTVLGVGRPGL